MKSSNNPSDKEILTAANQVLEQYKGDVLDAKLHAARLADEFMEKGDIDGNLVWLKIYRAILDLTDTEMEEGDTLH